MLNIGFIIFLKNLPKMYGILVLDKTSVTIKNGRREGTTELAHNLSPDFAACIFELENKIKQMRNIRKISDNTFLFILKTKNLNFFI